jgi:hypothetical protein
MYGKGHLAYQTINTTYSPCETETERMVHVLVPQKGFPPLLLMHPL